jgi:hypothetical protein
MSVKLFRRMLLIIGAAVALAAAALPSASYAAPPKGGSGGDSSYCDTLLARIKLYDSIAKDRSEPARVRAFYKARAAALVAQGQSEGCSWAPRSRSIKGGGKTGVPGAGAMIASVKATTTGDKQHDEYCRGVAALIENAEREGDSAAVGGDPEGAAEWYALAEYFLERATRNGCRFTFLRHRAGGVQPPQTIAVSPR